MHIELTNHTTGEVFRLNDNDAWITMHGNGEITIKFEGDQSPPVVLVHTLDKFTLERA